MANRIQKPPSKRSLPPRISTDSGGSEGTLLRIDGGFWMRLAMGCDRLGCTLTETPASLQDRRDKSPDPAGFQGQSNIAIGPLAAIVRADFGDRNIVAGRLTTRGLKDIGDEKMFVTPAFAQGTSLFGGDLLTNVLPFVLIFVIMYFLILRPQQKRAKEHTELIKNLRRGDTVITSGGLVGKVTKVVDDEQIEVEIADGVRVRQVRSMVSGVRAKGEPVKDESS